MSPADLVLAGVILLIAAPAARWNITAAGLALSWLMVQVLWFLLPGGRELLADEIVYTIISFGLDWLVIALIYCKLPSYDCFPYDNRLHQLACFWLERSRADRVILIIFLLLWLAYVLPISSELQHQAQFWLTIIQVLAAGSEAFGKFQRRRAANAAKRAQPDTPPSGMKYAWAGVEGYE